MDYPSPMFLCRIPQEPNPVMCHSSIGNSSCHSSIAHEFAFYVFHIDLHPPPLPLMIHGEVTLTHEK